MLYIDIIKKINTFSQCLGSYPSFDFVSLSTYYTDSLEGYMTLLELLGVGTQHLTFFIKVYVFQI